LIAVAQIARFYRLAADPIQLEHDLAAKGRAITSQDVLRAAKLAGLKSRWVASPDAKRLGRLPTPAILETGAGYLILAAVNGESAAVASPGQKAERISLGELL
jgi:subfamily B ATP-binding cassette protein HlyB/CyaB